MKNRKNQLKTLTFSYFYQRVIIPVGINHFAFQIIVTDNVEIQN